MQINVSNLEKTKLICRVTFVFFVLSLSINLNKAFAKSHCKRIFAPVEKIKCHHKRKSISGLAGRREVVYALPKIAVPSGGFPIAIIFQGSFFTVEFERMRGLPFGAYNEVKLIKNLLDNGFAVIAPRAFSRVAWQTNIIGMNYDNSGDKFFMNRLLDAIEVGDFGDLNFERLFAVGISSGGYMTDRMAQSHSDRPWRALAIASASYATCGGPLCNLPTTIDKNHPPTLFMHGEKDKVVPLYTMRKYARLLKRNKVYIKKVIDKESGHKWLKSAPIEVVRFFKQFL